MKTLFIIFQYLVPQHLLSRAAGWLANCEIVWLKNLMIKCFIGQYKVDMSEAVESDPKYYSHFNHFFTRAIKPELRPVIQGETTIVHPADGCVSQLGDIRHGRLFQAKGQYFKLTDLLGGDENQAKLFEDGQFATVYLSPSDYHRVHMPAAGTLRSMTYIPGDLFSVNDTTAKGVSNLFARNERAVCLFDTEFGPMAVILVGAMIVAGIETVWAGQVAPLKRQVQTTNYQAQPKTITLAKGEEMGRFKLGSTVIVLFGKDAMQWDSELHAGTVTRMGSLMGEKQQ